MFVLNFTLIYFYLFFTFIEDLINHDNDALRERVADLEKKVHDQADEIVCLRGTLADVLRRVTQLEGRGKILLHCTI